MKILITGGAGFIGFHLASVYANKKDNVTLLDNFSRGQHDNELELLIKRDNVNFINIDLTRPLNNIGRDYDVVYHLVAVNGTHTFYEKPYYTSYNNLLSLINLINWMKTCSSKARLIWTSSSETYACTYNKTIPTPETIDLCIHDISNPRWSYATSKIAGENMVLNCGLDSIVVRPHNCYGPRMGYGLVIPDLIDRIKKIKQGSIKDLNLESDGLETRTFCYIDDFINGLNIVCEKGKANSIYNIGSDSGEISIFDLTRKMLKLFDVDTKIIFGAGWMGSVIRRCPDISKMRKLGFNPKTSLDSGLKKTIGWYS